MFVSGRAEMVPAADEEALAQMLRETLRIGLWLDTSEQPAQETADEILRRAEDARVR